MWTLTRRAFLAVMAALSPALRATATAAPTTLADFMALSERLVGRTGLDREVGKVFLDALNADRDQAPTLQYLVEINNNPTPEMKALAATVLGWWYTGVYQIGGTDRLATHTGALVWGAMNMPAPGTCAGAFGAWANSPRSAP